MRNRIFLLSLPLLLALAGCPAHIEAPTASIGEVAPANTGDFVRLDGSGSSDPQDLPLSFHWVLSQLPQGSLATLSDPKSETPNIRVDVDGEYVVELVVNNGMLTSPAASATIVAGPCGMRTPQIDGMSASDEAPDLLQAISLSAEVSDADVTEGCQASPELQWAWTLEFAPAGSTATLSDPAAVSPSLTVDLSGAYGFALVVTDATGLSSEVSRHEVVAGPCGTRPPVLGAISASNTLPVIGEAVSLSSFVSDPDVVEGCQTDAEVTWSWALEYVPAGSAAALNNTSAVSPSFAPDLPGAYGVAVSVTDSTGLVSAVQRLEVTSGACGSGMPIAQVGVIGPIPAVPSNSVAVGGIALGFTVQVDGSASYDEDDSFCGVPTILSYQWTLSALPPGSGANLNGNNLVSPSFTLDQAGDYVLNLRVSDGQNWSAPAQVTVTADPTAGVVPAPGGSIEWVAGGTGIGFNAPQGLTMDALGRLYVVQEGNNSVLMIDQSSGVSSVFTVGGFLGQPADIALDPAQGVFFVTSPGLRYIVRVDGTGYQELWADWNMSNRDPFGIQYYTDSNNVPRLVVADDNDDRLYIYDPNDAAITSWLFREDANWSFNRPWGVAAAVVNGTTTFWSVDDPDRIIRWDGNNDQRQTDGIPVNRPRDLVYDSGRDQLYIASNRNGAVLAMDNCNNWGNCNVTVLLSGLQAPVGLFYDSTNDQLYITDEVMNGLYRLTLP